MDDAEELRMLRRRIRSCAHDVFNVLGIALNYLDFLGEDVAGDDLDHPIWQQVTPIQDAVRRAVTTVRTLRDEIILAEEAAMAAATDPGASVDSREAGPAPEGTGADGGGATGA